MRAAVTDIGPVKLFQFYPNDHKDSRELTERQAEVDFPRAQFRWPVVAAANLRTPKNVIPF